jgi:hypothetical protein
MNCTLCKQEIESEPQIRNNHEYHECCAITYDKDEKTILTNLKSVILILGHFFKIKK